MISKLLSAVKKETLILLRDRVGLSILFIMPMVLIFVMTLIQDSAFKTLNEKGIPIVFVDEDKDSLGISIEQGLRNSDLCYFHDSINGMPATVTSVKQAVADGKFLVGIIIPKGATEAIRSSVKRMVQKTLGVDTTKKVLLQDTVDITICIDPITKKSFLSSVTSTLREFITSIKTKIMFRTFSDEISAMMPDKKEAPNEAFNQTQIIKYSEIYAEKGFGEIVPNAVQHNVPAWSIFAMFFIVLPLASSMVKEKNEGSMLRIQTMPTNFLILINAKIVVYVIVCFIQFALMISVGLIFLPMLGLPKLAMGNSMFGVVILTIVTAFAATGYGVMVGTIAKTEQQGVIMGSLTVLLLSAIGGIWVPTYVMPEMMSRLSAWSPLNWSLNGFYELFLRGGGIISIIPEIIKLMLFFLLTMSIASIANRVKRKV